MHIYFSFIANQTYSVIKQHVIRPLTTQSKKIFVIMTIAFSGLAIFYAIQKVIQKSRKLNSEELSVSERNTQQIAQTSILGNSFQSIKKAEEEIKEESKEEIKEELEEVEEEIKEDAEEETLNEKKNEIVIQPLPSTSSTHSEETRYNNEGTISSKTEETFDQRFEIQKKFVLDKFSLNFE